MKKILIATLLATTLVGCAISKTEKVETSEGTVTTVGGKNKLLKNVGIPEGWDIESNGTTGYMNGTYISRDYVDLRKDEATLSVSASLLSYVDPGKDVRDELNFDEEIDDLKIGNYTYSGGITDGTYIYLSANGFPSQLFDGYGELIIFYENPEGVSVEDKELITALKMVEVEDNYGTLTVTDDNAELIESPSELSKCKVAGKATKGRTYKVRAMMIWDNNTWFRVDTGEDIWIEDNGNVEYKGETTVPRLRTTVIM